MDGAMCIGKSIRIRGELTGSEDLTIDGTVEGKIVLKDHDLKVGTNASVSAEIHARSVTVLGRVVGNIKAGDKVEVAAGGTLQGEVHAPRIILADGALFQGGIDMEPRPATERPVRVGG
jgi:cytoskeletal protein CcmA (bactofilin family)